eukprot:TRINITY_DN1762_c0_g3_i1.p1 TRINITY_DN1762_c0_g3~~TRINITY_DN1762_c0_g3_i1.p1  ORF type:complete len:349 (+),score=58.39 TRINITY_DN1762_c0_g3_i1:79-1125(+)
MAPGVGTAVGVAHGQTQRPRPLTTRIATATAAVLPQKHLVQACSFLAEPHPTEGCGIGGVRPDFVLALKRPTLRTALRRQGLEVDDLLQDSIRSPSVGPCSLEHRQRLLAQALWEEELCASQRPQSQRSTRPRPATERAPTRHPISRPLSARESRFEQEMALADTMRHEFEARERAAREARRSREQGLDETRWRLRQVNVLRKEEVAEFKELEQLRHADYAARTTEREQARTMQDLERMEYEKRRHQELRAAQSAQRRNAAEQNRRRNHAQDLQVAQNLTAQREQAQVSANEQRTQHTIARSIGPMQLHEARAMAGWQNNRLEKVRWAERCAVQGKLDRPLCSPPPYW